MHVESVDTPSLLELRAIVAQRLRAYGAFEEVHRRGPAHDPGPGLHGHLASDRGGGGAAALSRAPRFPGRREPYETVLDTMTRLCPDVIAAVQGYVAAWRARFRQDGWHPTQWAGAVTA